MSSAPARSEPESERDGEHAGRGNAAEPASEATSRDEAASGIETRRSPEEMRVLAVTGLAHKNELHYGPLADVARETTLVCLEPERAIDEARYVEVPDVGPRIVRIVLMFFLALYEGYRNEYDAVVSISLLPYGCYALALRAVYGLPAHLGIIGVDLDHHADRWYGGAVRRAFRSFDAVSVPGSAHAEKLERLGVSPERIRILTNAIDTETYGPPAEDVEPEYDFVWIGRFSDEKAPRRFVEALETLERDGRDGRGDPGFRAVMVGDGPLRSDVEALLEERGLRDAVDLPGWVDDPLEYYHRSDAFVSTSRRDALPLVMVEAMATGLPCIVPAVGSISDVVTDGENGVVVADRDPGTFARTMERFLDDPEHRDAVAPDPAAIRAAFSPARASDDWRRILTVLAD